MIPIVSEVLDRLTSTDMSFESLYSVISGSFHDETFARYIKNGQIVAVSYDKMAAMVDETACAIAAMADSGRSDIIGIYMDNSVEWVVLFWGILKAGFKPLLLNTRQETAVSAEIVADLKPALIIADKENKMRLADSTTYEDIINATKDAPTKTDENKPNSTDVEWSDNILLVTSGSTRKPKIVVHNGNSICSQILLTADILDRNITLRHNRKLEINILAFLPFYHVFGLVTTMMWFTVFGRTLIFLQDYSAATIQYTCQRMEVTHFFAVPMVWDMLVRKFMREVEKQGKMKAFTKLMHISNSLQTISPRLGTGIVRNILFKKIRNQMLGNNLHFLIAGGGFISLDTLEVMNALGYSLYVGYGLTECGIVCVNLSRKAKKRISHGCGPIFSNVDYRVNENGELEIESSNCFVGMYVDGVFVPNESEYYNTNDIVAFGADNDLIIRGRSDGVIITENGENISPEAVEAKLDKSGFASVTMVYAGKDKKIIAVVENEPGTSVTRQAQAIKDLYASFDGLPIAERPAKVIRLLGEVPYNLKGVDRKKLTDGLNDDTFYYEECVIPTDADIELYTSEEYKKILGLVKESFAAVLTSEEEIYDTTDFVSAGGDSMMYVELISVISEKMGTQIGMPDKPLVTPADFADYIMKEFDS